MLFLMLVVSAEILSELLFVTDLKVTRYPVKMTGEISQHCDLGCKFITVYLIINNNRIICFYENNIINIVSLY